MTLFDAVLLSIPLWVVCIAIYLILDHISTKRTREADKKAEESAQEILKRLRGEKP